MKSLSQSVIVSLLLAMGASEVAIAEPATSNAIPVLDIHVDRVTGQVSPTLYGLMTEEINYSYEGVCNDN